MITTQEIERIKQLLIEVEKPQKIILFGSYAYGIPNEDSDIDVLVISQYKEPRRKRGLNARQALAKLLLPIDIVFYTQEEVEKMKEASLAFITSIIQKGKVIYE